MSIQDFDKPYNTKLHLSEYYLTELEELFKKCEVKVYAAKYIIHLTDIIKDKYYFKINRLDQNTINQLWLFFRLNELTFEWAVFPFENNLELTIWVK